ncbi:serine/threonine-protein kinase [Paludisphaera mucosa]|uniref:Serine/threonine-protein kinase n=1 Tax=Paludisphaera mucosa TaxID=3030827 RepID=A0ABT6FK83_9BACT|nr:serine/threonine-protein kinase [Paludisphaera mucosa]MDG3007795.1 serine/threonine-protein kinase [Paludisphaera mucosa]
MVERTADEAGDVPPTTVADRVVEGRRGAESRETQTTSARPPDLDATTDPGVESASAVEPPGPPEGLLVRYFGDYELAGVLGRGGMGVVYQARQISLNRRVALKMIRADEFASDDERRRFQNEAEAVALLDHPNIVPIYEVGEHQGRRYFSMKLIEGEGLDRRLAAFRRDPSAAARLAATAAEAVHHAHQRGVLHRDLKPANILLDERGAPYVTDFGLARRLGAGPDLTQSGAILGTPGYMAPEQAGGRRAAVTTASDVYGLGTVIYAMLAGRAPFIGSTAMETIEQVRNRPPEPPSRHNPDTPRDLEVICLKCLEKDPRRRYGSAQALADDLRRWIAGEPISARPVAAPARFGLWCRRQPALAGLSAALATAVVAGVAGVAWKWREAERAGAESRRAADIAQAINRFLVDDILAQAAPENNPRDRKVTVEEALDRSSAKIRGAFAGKLEIEAAVRGAIGRTYRSLGEYDKAEPHLREALALGARAKGDDDPATLAAVDALASLMQDRNDWAGAERLFRSNLEARRRVLGARHPDVLESMNNLALLLYYEGKPAEAASILSLAVPLSEAIKGPDHGDTAEAMNNLGGVLLFQDRLPEAEPILKRGVELSLRVKGEDHPHTLGAMNSLATLRQKRGDLAGAEAMFRRIIDVRTRVQGEDHADVLVAKNNLAVLLRDRKDLAGAEVVARQVAEGFDRTLGPDVPNTLFAKHNLAAILRAEGRRPEAEKLFREVLEGRRRRLTSRDPNLADTVAALGGLLAEDGRAAEGEPLLKEALAIYREALPAGHAKTKAVEERLERPPPPPTPAP